MSRKFGFSIYNSRSGEVVMGRCYVAEEESDWVLQKVEDGSETVRTVISDMGLGSRGGFRHCRVYHRMRVWGICCDDESLVGPFLLAVRRVDWRRRVMGDLMSGGVSGQEILYMGRQLPNGEFHSVVFSDFGS
jgi:hypothetical protein